MNKFIKSSQSFFFGLLCLTFLAGGQAFAQINDVFALDVNTISSGSIRLTAGYNTPSSAVGLIFATHNDKVWGAFDQVGVLQINPVTNANHGFAARPAIERLYVNGGFTVEDTLKIESKSFPDYVFAHNYNLMSLDELGTYIQKNKHLPKVPKAEKVIKEGMDVAQMNVLLMEKVEELTLYTIARHKQIKQLRKKVETLEKSLKK